MFCAALQSMTIAAIDACCRVDRATRNRGQTRQKKISPLQWLWFLVRVSPLPFGNFPVAKSEGMGYNKKERT